MSRATPVTGVFVQTIRKGDVASRHTLPVVGLDFDFITGDPIVWVINQDGKAVKLESLRAEHLVDLVERDD